MMSNFPQMNSQNLQEHSLLTESYLQRWNLKQILEGEIFNMANRRMISKFYSYSKDFNALGEFEQLLFLMIQPHLDDFGKIEGDNEVIKARILPLSKKPIEDFEIAISNLTKSGLIERYEVSGIKIIRYPKFEKEQTGLNKRTKSEYPDPEEKTNSDKFPEILRNSLSTEQKGKEENLIKAKITEEIAGNNSFKNIGVVNPKSFIPKTDAEAAAFDAWKKLEPRNPLAFQTTYLKACNNGLPAHLFHQFVSEIYQSESVNKPGAVFNQKVKDYLKADPQKEIDN